MKQEKAKGKAQESRRQHRFPQLFDRTPPSHLNADSICNFSRESFWLRFGMGGGAGWVREPHRLLCAYYPYPSLLVKVRGLALLHQRFGLPDR